MYKSIFLSLSRSLSTQLNFSQENYFENILENLAASAQKGHKKLREPVDPHMYEPPE